MCVSVSEPKSSYRFAMKCEEYVQCAHIHTCYEIDENVFDVVAHISNFENYLVLVGSDSLGYVFVLFAFHKKV